MTTYRNIRVNKPGGGHRIQRAMVLASGKLKFVKNTAGRSTATNHRKATTVAKKKKHRKSTTAISHRRKSHPARRSHRRRRSGGGGKQHLIPIALGAAGLAYVMGASGPKTLKDAANKIPGVKTFGPVAMTGIACLAVDRFVKPNKWLKIAGVVGVVAAALKVGEQGTAFKWVGDDDIGDYDLSDIGDDDVGDDEDIGDDDE